MLKVGGSSGVEYTDFQEKVYEKLFSKNLYPPVMIRILFLAGIAGCFHTIRLMSVIFIGMLTLSSLLIAPIFGVALDNEELVLASFFGVFALLVLYLNIGMIQKRINKMALLLISASLLWISL